MIQIITNVLIGPTTVWMKCNLDIVQLWLVVWIPRIRFGGGHLWWLTWSVQISIIP